MSDRWFMPIAGITLLIAFIVSLVAAFGTKDWRYLSVTVICYVILAAR